MRNLTKRLVALEARLTPEPFVIEVWHTIVERDGTHGDAQLVHTVTL